MSVLAATADTRPPLSAAATMQAGAFARVEVHERPWSALRAWREIESFATGTAYQTLGFILPWYENIAAAQDVAPLVIVAYDPQNRPAALLPMAIVRRGPARIAMFAGGKHSNLNMPLLRPGAAPTPDEARALLLSAAASAASRVDLFLLLNQPTARDGVANPFAALNPMASPSFAYGAAIGADAEAFLKRIDSSSTRKKLKSKASKLAALGPVKFERARDPDRARTILEAFVDQKILRFSQKHRDPGVSGVAVRAFLDALATGQCGGPLALDFYALSVGDRIVATYGGLPRGRNWHGLINSFSPAPEIARSSPAELLLRHIIRDLSARGVERFDLGIGESRYKSAICDETIALADSIVPCTATGRLWAPIEASRLATKRWVKQRPWALSFVEQMRAGPA